MTVNATCHFVLTLSGLPDSDELLSIQLSVGMRMSTARNLDLDPCVDSPSLMASKPGEELGSL